MIRSQVKIAVNLKVYRRRGRQVRRKGSTSCINQQLIQTELHLSQQFNSKVVGIAKLNEVSLTKVVQW
jgi:hypothetical protein